MPVRKRRKDEVDAAQISVELLEGCTRICASEVRMDGTDRLARLALAEQLRGREHRVRGNQPQQLAADVARGTKDRRPNHGRLLFTGLHIYASECIFTR